MHRSIVKPVSPSRNLALRCDGSGTYFDKHAVEVYICCEGRTKLIDVINWVDISAAEYLSRDLELPR